MSIIEIIVMGAFSILIVYALVRCTIAVLTTRRIVKDIDQKTWERIEGWRK